MDMKQFAGKNIAIQFKPGLMWYVHTATSDGMPMLKLDSPKRPEPVMSPFLLGEVQEDGALRICTDAGGELDVYLADESVFSVSVVSTPATGEVSQFARRSPEESGNGRIVTPGN